MRSAHKPVPHGRVCRGTNAFTRYLGDTFLALGASDQPFGRQDDGNAFIIANQALIALSEKAAMANTASTSGAVKQLTPLWVISLFLSLTETTLGIAATKTSGTVQLALIVFVMAFPLLVAIAFFTVLWARPYVFYPPSEYAKVDIQKFVDAVRGGDRLVTKTSDLKGEIQIFGRPDRFKLLFKATGANWLRSTKAMEVPGGCLVQVSTTLHSPGGEEAAEALAFVPNAFIQDETEGSGAFLVTEPGGRA
jgi:hypothetical protein